jgi:hypothetical protein
MSDTHMLSLPCSGFGRLESSANGNYPSRSVVWRRDRVTLGVPWPWAHPAAPAMAGDGGGGRGWCGRREVRVRILSCRGGATSTRLEGAREATVR